MRYFGFATYRSRSIGALLSTRLLGPPAMREASACRAIAVAVSLGTGSGIVTPSFVTVPYVFIWDSPSLCPRVTRGFFLRLDYRSANGFNLVFIGGRHR